MAKLITLSPVRPLPPLQERLAALLRTRTSGRRLGHHIPGTLAAGAVVDVTTDVGQLYLHAQDQVMTPWISAHGAWEPEESTLLRRVLRPGCTFVDVGANVGYFSVLGSQLVGGSGRVIAVEPEPRNLALLRANLWRHGCANVEVLPVAAHTERGFLPMLLNEENRGDHQVGRTEGSDLLVPCGRLDELLDGMRIDFIKIDTQGVDHDVVAGLSGLLRQERAPTIMCEFWIEGMETRGLDPGEIAAGYQRLGLDLALLDDGGQERAVSAAELVQAARTAKTGFVNAILRRAAR